MLCSWWLSPLLTRHSTRQTGRGYQSCLQNCQTVSSGLSLGAAYPVPGGGPGPSADSCSPHRGHRLSACVGGTGRRAVLSVPHRALGLNSRNLCLVRVPAQRGPARLASGMKPTGGRCSHTRGICGAGSPGRPFHPGSAGQAVCRARLGCREAAGPRAPLCRPEGPPL